MLLIFIQNNDFECMLEMLQCGGSDEYRQSILEQK